MKVFKPVLLAMLCAHALCTSAEEVDKLYSERITAQIPTLSIKEGNIYYAMDATQVENLVKNGLDISNVNTQNLMSAELSGIVKSSVVNIGDKQEANSLVVEDGHVKLVKTYLNKALYIPHIAMANK